jgi:Glycosyl transferase family 2
VTKKILLAAIAKDEAAYLPEWIFYHLELGVDGILIYVNNTSDNSVKILDKIAVSYPSVRYLVVDGIELSTVERELDLLDPEFLQRNPLQSIAFARIYNDTAAEEFSHILYFDLDEFLYDTSQDSDSLRDEITGTDLTYVPWFNLSGDARTFQLIDSCGAGESYHRVKYIVRSGLGNPVFHSTHEITVSNISTKHSTRLVLLHRHLRSLDEYLALIGRGDTYRNSFNGFKMARIGWSTEGKESLHIEPPHGEFYRQRYSEFLRKTGIQSDIEDAREFVINRKREVEVEIAEIRKFNRKLEQILWGTGQTHYPFTLLSLFKRKIRKIFRPPNVNRSG